MTGFHDLALALRARIRLVIAMSLLVFLLVMTLALIQPGAYTANSSLIIDPSANEEGAAANPQFTDSLIGTELDILQSQAVLATVVRRDPAFADRQSDTVAVQELRRHFVASVEKGSNVIQLSYTADKPEAAARILNSIGDVYLAKQGDLKTSSARKDMGFYTERAAEARAKLETAQRELTTLQQQSGLIGVGRVDLDGDQARNLAAALVQAQADAAQASSKSGASSDPSVIQSQIFQDLQRDIGQQASKVAELSRELGPSHPTLQAAQAQLASLRQSLGTARAAQAQALRSASMSASRRVGELSGQLARQRSQMLSQASVQDRIDILGRDVDAARGSYDTIRKRLNQIELQSRDAQSDAVRLDRATPPKKPSKPSLAAWTLAAIILGGAAGPMLVFLFEFLRPRVRSAAGAARSLQTDVIVDMNRHASASGWNIARDQR